MSLDVNVSKNVGLKVLLTPAGWKDGSGGNAQDITKFLQQDESYVESRNSPENRDFSVGTGSSDFTEKLKMEMKALKRQSELEKKSLRKQEIKESKWIQDLSKEVSCVTGERDGALEE